MQKWTTGPFTDVRSFDLATIGPKPTLEVDETNDSLTLTWEPQPEAIGYILNFEPVSPTTPAVQSLSTTKPSTVLSGYEPGNYNVTVTTRYPDKMTSLASEPTRVKITPVALRVTKDVPPANFRVGDKFDFNGLYSQ